MPKLPIDIFPLKITIVHGNVYRLPIGKIFFGRYKDGDGSPYPIEVIGDHKYQFKESEIKIERRNIQ